MSMTGPETHLDVLSAAERWRAEGRGVALATVVETWGSAPRPVGSHQAPTRRPLPVAVLILSPNVVSFDLNRTTRH